MAGGRDRIVNVLLSMIQVTIRPHTVLLFDGGFMLRPELREHWDLSIYLHVDPEVSVSRARIRDLDVFGSVDVIEERYRTRYLPGQANYRADADPLAVATIVLDMNDPQNPVIVRRSGQAADD